MSQQELTIFKSGQLNRSKLFDQVKGGQNTLSAGVGAGFARVSYKGGKWGIRYQGETRMLRRYKQAPTGQWVDDGAEDNLDCVIVAAAEHPSKYWYKDQYDPRQEVSKPPDCWSSNGVAPDSGVKFLPEGRDKGGRQSDTCVSCPHNGWGSAKAGPDGKARRGKACTDHKRLVVVPVGDIENKAYGGPMMLQVPPTSLKFLAPYENKLAHAGFRFFEVWSRIFFAQDSEFPLLSFDAVAPLNDEQGALVIKMMNDPLVDRILTTDIAAVEGYDTPPDSPVPPPPANPPPVSQPAPRPSMMPTATTGMPPQVSPPAPAAVAPDLKTMLEGVSAEKLVAIMAELQGRAKAKAAPKKETKARTPTPSPKPQDSTPQPSAMPPPAVTVASNGHVEEETKDDDDTATKILDRIQSLVNQSAS
jgi:hypothetical protein